MGRMRKRVVRSKTGATGVRRWGMGSGGAIGRRWGGWRGG